MDRPNLRQFFDQRNIDTRHVPLDVLSRAQKVVEGLEHGEPYMNFRGKRLRRNRKRISIPLGLKWRILADEVDGQPLVRRIMSHIIPEWGPDLQHPTRSRMKGKEIWIF
jgi:hypothetical protein